MLLQLTGSALHSSSESEFESGTISGSPSCHATPTKYNSNETVFQNPYEVINLQNTQCNVMQLQLHNSHNQ